MNDQPQVEIDRCPNCGSSDIDLDESVGKLHCNVCRTVFEGTLANAADFMSGKHGEERGKNSEDIVKGDGDILVCKCSSCGAEVVINTQESTTAHCHWCRHILEVKDRIKNGTVPDLVLPFKISRKEAIKRINEAVNEKSAANNSPYRLDLKPDEVVGVYFPYLIVDVQAVMKMDGFAEKSYGIGKAKRYKIKRYFDLSIDDLMIESSERRLNQNLNRNTNNIINALMPYDTENAVEWDASFLRGYTSEQRDVNVNDMKQTVALMAGDIARHRAKQELLKDYDRGAHWVDEKLSIKATKWRTIYAPVWMYTRDVTPDKEGDEYIVVLNGRTGEIAAHMSGISIGGRIASDIRHYHESETRAVISNVDEKDEFVRELNTNGTSKIRECNDDRVIGSLSVGRSAMNMDEQARFKPQFGNTGMKTTLDSERYYKTWSDDSAAMRTSPSSEEKMLVKIILIVFGLMFVVMFLASALGIGGGGDSGSSYDYDYDYSSGSGWDWSDSGSGWDWDSGGGYDSSSDWGSGGGFDFDYDY